MRLGDYLVESGAIAREAMELHASQSRGRLGDYLRSCTRVGGLAIARALATHHQLPLLLFSVTPPQRHLFTMRDVPDYIERRYVPYALSGNILTIATSEPSESLKNHIEEMTGFRVALAVATSRDITRYIGEAGAVSITRRALLSLRRIYPSLVAHRVLTRAQRNGLLVIAALAALGFFVAPTRAWEAILILCNLFYLATLAFKLVLYREGKKAYASLRDDRSLLLADVAQLKDEDLPIYTLLIPLYQEPATILTHLLRNLEALDYPKDTLDIKLILEADDHATIKALQSLHPPEYMDIIRVPPSQPRTKPKACNVAMQQVRGEYLAIYDAEDAPEPDQLKRAIATFERVDSDVVCLQAPLNYYNRNDNLLTQLFAIEYRSLFHCLLPALARMELPIPLGGTSNHLRVQALKAIGGWDAFNVTEDADLGMRLSYLGYKTRMLDSLTLEEAPISLHAWMKQRTRWIKGYLQTWLVYMRNPSELRRRLGNRGYYGFQFFIGAPALTFLLAPVFWLIFIFASAGLIPVTLSPTMLGLCLVSFMGGIASHWQFARAALRQEQWHMPLALLVFPLYWLLHSVASFRAVWQLATDPHYWDKTKHGISRGFTRHRFGRQTQ